MIIIVSAFAEEFCEILQVFQPESMARCDQHFLAPVSPQQLCERNAMLYE